MISDDEWHHVVHHINLETGEDELWVDGEKQPPVLNVYYYDPSAATGSDPGSVE